MKDNEETIIYKILSANDTGDTGAHQAGICVPKDPDILNYFPPLDASQKNPRQSLSFYDADRKKWEFNFIYYNNKFFGGTRNEYRLTRMIPFIRSNGLNPGDRLILKKNIGGKRFVEFKRAQKSRIGKDVVLKLGSTWKTIQI